MYSNTLIDIINVIISKYTTLMGYKLIYVGNKLLSSTELNLIQVVQFFPHNIVFVNSYLTETNKLHRKF